MDGVYRGDQFWEHSYSFYSRAHFKSGTNVDTYVCVILIY